MHICVMYLNMFACTSLEATQSYLDPFFVSSLYQKVHLRQTNYRCRIIFALTLLGMVAGSFAAVIQRNTLATIWRIMPMMSTISKPSLLFSKSMIVLAIKQLCKMFIIVNVIIGCHMFMPSYNFPLKKNTCSPVHTLYSGSFDVPPSLFADY